MALAALLVLGGCRAYGGGYIGEPLPGGPVSVYDGDANFGFNFTCEMNKRAKRALIMGEITYHDSGASTIGGVQFPEIRLHGTVDPFFVAGVSTCEQAAEMLAGLPVVQFEGTYRPQDKTPAVSEDGPDGRFIVQVFDQGEPGRTREEFVTGDGFSIELIGWRLRRLHPGRLHRGRQHPGGAVEVATGAGPLATRTPAWSTPMPSALQCGAL